MFFLQPVECCPLTMVRDTFLSFLLSLSARAHIETRTPEEDEKTSTKGGGKRRRAMIVYPHSVASSFLPATRRDYAYWRRRPALLPVNEMFCIRRRWETCRARAVRLNWNTPRPELPVLERLIKGSRERNGVDFPASPISQPRINVLSDLFCADLVYTWSLFIYTSSFQLSKR